MLDRAPSNGPRNILSHRLQHIFLQVTTSILLVVAYRLTGYTICPRPASIIARRRPTGHNIRHWWREGALPIEGPLMVASFSHKGCSIFVVACNTPCNIFCCRLHHLAVSLVTPQLRRRHSTETSPSHSRLCSSHTHFYHSINKWIDQNSRCPEK